MAYFNSGSRILSLSEADRAAFLTAVATVLPNGKSIGQNLESVLAFAAHIGTFVMESGMKTHIVATRRCESMASSIWNVPDTDLIISCASSLFETVRYERSEGSYDPLRSAREGVALLQEALPRNPETSALALSIMLLSYPEDEYKYRRDETSEEVLERAGFTQKVLEELRQELNTEVSIEPSLGVSMV